MQNDESSLKLFKGVVYFLVLVTLAALGGAYYLYDGMDKNPNPVKTLRQQAKPTVQDIYRIRGYLAPSLAAYHKKVDAGVIEAPDESLMDGTYDAMRALRAELNLDAQAMSITPEQFEDKPVRNTNLTRHWLEVELIDSRFDTCNSLIEEVNRRFASYATVAELEIDLANERKLRLDNRRVPDAEAKWTLSFTLQWFKADESKESSNSPRSSGGGRPS